MIGLWELLHVLHGLVYCSCGFAKGDHIPIAVQVLSLIELQGQVTPEHIDRCTEAHACDMVEPQGGNEQDIPRLQYTLTAASCSKFREAQQIRLMNVDNL